MRSLGYLAVACVTLSACALKGDVRRVENEVQQLRAEMARADSARADFLDVTFEQIIALQQELMDSVLVQSGRLAAFQGQARTDMTEVLRLLVQTQELTGQSQQRLSELQHRLEERERTPVIATLPAGGDTSGVATPPGDLPSADEMYNVSIQQLRRGSVQTARQGFQLLLATYPTDPRAGDAVFHIGESWERTDPDSAASAYEMVAQRFQDSPRAPTALYRLGLLAEQRGDLDAAKVYYTRVVSGYPRSDAAELARAKLNPGR
ncbi:MAG: tol-pal system YbgF family protein [Gemmatimonadales bacterium]